MKKFILAALLAAIALPLAAQNIQSTASSPAQGVFKGRVVDADGAPMPGAYIRIVGREGGLVCDIDGGFELTGVDFPATLVVSFMGYKDTTVPVSGKEAAPFVITLTDSENFLDDVVVVG